MVIEQGPNGAGNDGEKIVDIRPTFLKELKELPREISGTVRTAWFYDSNGWEPSIEFIIVNPEFVDKDGRTRQLQTNSRGFFFKKEDPEYPILKSNRWVLLEALIQTLKILGKSDSVDIKFVLKQNDTSSEPAR